MAARCLYDDEVSLAELAHIKRRSMASWKVRCSDFSNQ